MFLQKVVGNIFEKYSALLYDGEVEGKMRSELKFLANQAKRRLQNAAECSNERYTRVNHINKSTYFYKNMATMHKKVGCVEYVMIEDKEDEAFVRKVEKIIIEDQLLNPIGRLIDKKYYQQLNNVDKEFYLLKLIDRYNKVKDQYMKENAL